MQLPLYNDIFPGIKMIPCTSTREWKSVQCSWLEYVLFLCNAVVKCSTSLSKYLQKKKFSEPSIVRGETSVLVSPAFYQRQEMQNIFNRLLRITDYFVIQQFRNWSTWLNYKPFCKPSLLFNVCWVSCFTGLSQEIITLSISNFPSCYSRI